MTNGTRPSSHQQWGDSYQDAAPSDVLTSETPPNFGIRHQDGRIECGGCGLVQADNSSPGLKASCSTCWAAIDVVTPSKHRFAFPSNYSLIG